MSHPPPSAPPLVGPPNPPLAYPPPTYTQPPLEEPPPYYPSPPEQAAPLPTKDPLPNQPPYQQPVGCPSPQQAFPPPPQYGYQAPHPGFNQTAPPPSGYQTAPPTAGYQTPPLSGYQTTPPVAGYHTEPPPSGYQTTPPVAGYQAVPPSSGYQTTLPPAAGYQASTSPTGCQTTSPQSTAVGYQLPSSQSTYFVQPPQAQITNKMANMSLQQQTPTKAGDSPILSLFVNGSVVVLQSNASGKSLRIWENGDVQGTGGTGQFAQFCVHVRRPGVVSLQNVKNPDHWLAVFQGQTIGTGTGDPYCDFLLNEVEGKYVCLESVMSPGQYVGILPNGSVKPPGNTKTGQHGRFSVICLKPGDSASQHHVFSHGNIVILRSYASGKSLRITAGGKVQGTGGRGQFAQFRVHVRRPGVVALQNVHNSNNWLAIQDGNTLGTGRGGPYCEFEYTEIDGQFMCLESVMARGQRVGILPDGSVKSPSMTGTGPHGRFIASVHSSVPGLDVQSIFSQGNIVVLQSNASGKSLRIWENGDIQGTGGRGQFAQFRVHVRRPGVVALQNVHNPDHWLAIFQGQTIGTGKGGQFCEFKLAVVDGQYVCLESVMAPGQRVGILPDGTVKSPSKTGTGPHGRFIASVHSCVPGLDVQSMFSQGSIVILQSNASGKSLRISQFGDVCGTGGRGQFAQFHVHVRRPGVVALQNVHNPDHWLAVFQGKTIGTGKGGQFCEFKLVVVEGQYVCLESVMSPGQYVGILPNGSVKPPGSTKTGQHGRFIPSLHI